MKTLPEILDLRGIIVKHTSEMLDNPDEYGIYPTTKFYNDLEKAIAKELMGCLPEEKVTHPVISTNIYDSGWNDALDEIRARLTAFIGKEVR